MSWLRLILEILNLTTVTLSFVIAAVAAMYHHYDQATLFLLGGLSYWIIPGVSGRRK